MKVKGSYTLRLTRSLQEPGGPCTKSMEFSESRMERVHKYYRITRIEMKHSQSRTRRALLLYKMFCLEPEGYYRCTKNMAIAPF